MFFWSWFIIFWTFYALCVGKFSFTCFSDVFIQEEVLPDRLSDEEWSCVSYIMKFLFCYYCVLRVCVLCCFFFESNSRFSVADTNTHGMCLFVLSQMIRSCYLILEMRWGVKIWLCVWGILIVNYLKIFYFKGGWKKRQN